MKSRERIGQLITWILILIIAFCMITLLPKERERQREKTRIHIKIKQEDIGEVVKPTEIPPITLREMMQVDKVYAQKEKKTKIYLCESIISLKEATLEEIKEQMEANERQRLEQERIEKLKHEAEIREIAKEDIYFLAKAIHGEAGVANNAEKYRVGTVIMNRLERKDYPNTILQVLKQGYSCYGDKNWYNEVPTEKEYEIADDIFVKGVRVFDKTVVFQSAKCHGTLVYKSQWHEYGAKPLEE